MWTHSIFPAGPERVQRVQHVQRVERAHAHGRGFGLEAGGSLCLIMTQARVKSHLVIWPCVSVLKLSLRCCSLCPIAHRLHILLVA